MAASSLLSITSDSLSFCVSQSSLSNQNSAAVLKWGFRRDQDAQLISHRSNRQAFCVLANPNVSPRKHSSRKEVIMVDPSEAKRLAAMQMEAIKEKKKLKRRRKIKAINGACAMIGLTACLLLKGQTGNILSQLFGYWEAILHLFLKYLCGH